MEFQASARKWRPQKFSELIGQEHIVQTLKNAIDLDRVAHAYLFSGTRGVGKTTSARILAKALNCNEGVSADPCDECTNCVEIREGHSVDVLEIDGASNNGINEVRELIDNVQYSTSSCRYKVYIIDEVHMLSKAAFNALLKTLEEPPPRVVFIFATTEIIKIPETILSRCQCFEFKPLGHRQIMQQLELICKNDTIEIDPQSLEEIAKNGAGSMRDAQSLLDQVVAFCGRKIDAGSVESVLGIVGQEALQLFVDRLIAKDAPALLESIQETLNQGKDLGLFCRDLIEYLRHLVVVKVAKNSRTLLAGRSCDVEVLTRQAESLHEDELHQMFAVLSKADLDMKRSSLPQMVFEMAVVKLLDVRPFQDIDQMIDKINELGPPVHNGPDPVSNPGNPTPAGRQTSPVQEKGSYSSPAKQGGGSVAGGSPAAGGTPWNEIRRRTTELKKAFEHYLTHAVAVSLKEGNVHLSLPDPFTLDQVQKEENLEVLKNTIQEVCGFLPAKIKLDCAPPPADAEMDAMDPPQSSGAGKNSGPASGNDDKILKDALDIFGGTVIR